MMKQLMKASLKEEGNLLEKGMIVGFVSKEEED